MPRPKGSQNIATKEAREHIKTLFIGELDHIQTALKEVRKDNPGKYLELLSKFMPYWLPKMTEVALNSNEPKKGKLPEWMRQ
jgi:hypothetical protein